MRVPGTRRPHGESALLLQILKHTPPWVFGLFLGLVALGVAQRRTRHVPALRLAILPVAMLALSFVGVWSSFGADLSAVAAWAGAVLAVVAAGVAMPDLRGASYCAASRRFTVPGSWMPLAAMMCIFFAKYAVAVARATSGEIAGPAVVLTCVVCGLCSGLFLARAQRVARTARRDGDRVAGERNAA